MIAGIADVETFDNALSVAGRSCGRMQSELQPHLDSGLSRRQAAEAVLAEQRAVVLDFLESTPDIIHVVNAVRSSATR